jgi:large subunit ribosomal protein L23
MIMPGKVKRRGMSIGKRPNWKKAIVTLKGDDMIDFFATE